MAKLKVQTTPRTFRDAIEQVRSYAEASEMRPLLVTAYLAPERLEELEVRGMSGSDRSLGVLRLLAGAQRAGLSRGDVRLSEFFSPVSGS